MTLHHTLGTIVQDSAMSRASHTGLTSQVPLREGESMTRRPYVYMAPWSTFEEEVIGGGPLDTFSFGNHKYGPHSIVFIPQAEEAIFREANPDFKGTPVFYNPGSQNVSNLVTEHLRSNGA